MARSSKISETPSKTALKKAKRVGAKTKQDLAEEFSTTTDADAKTPYLDTIDASPVRILRNSEPIPALSPAPPILPIQIIPATIPTVPLVTVVIPAQPFAPLPVQITADPPCENLSIPAVCSCLNYERLRIKFFYLIDVKYCSSEDEMRAHIELLSKNRR